MEFRSSVNSFTCLLICAAWIFAKICILHQNDFVYVRPGRLIRRYLRLITISRLYNVKEIPNNFRKTQHDIVLRGYKLSTS